MKFLKEVFNHFLSKNTFQQGASLAYYAVFSLIPIIIITTSLLGLLFGAQAVSGDIYSQLKNILGRSASLEIQGIIKEQHTRHNSIITTTIGFAMLALSASGLFSQIHNSLNSLWNVKAKPKSSILKYFVQHAVSFLVLILSFFIIFISTAISSFIIKHSNSFDKNGTYLSIYEHLLSFSALGIVFTLMFKFLGDAVIRWKVAVLGGAITAIFFTFGKIGIAMYIGHSTMSTAFGSASFLAVLLLWVYYTSQIIFLGASFIIIISSYLGCEIQPNKNAVKIGSVEIND